LGARHASKRVSSHVKDRPSLNRLVTI